MEAFIGGMALLLDPKILLVVFLGTVIGIIVGALPGISGSTTTALLLPFTITMGPVPAIAFLGAIYCAANFGGSITAILVNSPGDPSASATAFDGYPMAQRGEAGRALGMSAVASAIGGIFSVVVLIIFAPLLARVAYSFGPPEYFALAVFGLSMVAMTGGDSAIKNLIAGAFGVLLATVGPGSDYRGRALHLRHPLLHRRHRVHPGADRFICAGRAVGAGGAARQANRRRQARRGAPAQLAGHEGLRQGDLALERARHLHRHPAGAWRDHRGDDRLRRDQALVEEQGRSSARARSRASPGRRPRTTPRSAARWCRPSRSASPAAPPPRSSSPASSCRASAPDRTFSPSSRCCSTRCSPRCCSPTCSTSCSAWDWRRCSRASA